MAISDTKLRTIYGKPYSGPQEVADADGLSVRISPKGVIQFQYRYRWHGKPNRLGLGRYPSLSLKDARLNRPGFPGECFICELRLPDHRFRWKHNKLFLLLPVGYGPAFPAIVDCYTSPPT